VYGWYFEVEGKSFIAPKDIGLEKDDYGDAYICDFIEVHPSTVSQSTGLQDENGEDLDWWEGDVFEDAGTLKVIIKDKGCFWFESVKSKRRIPCYQVVDWADDIKKIGNIHDEEKENG
jgi:hypothetical protein